MPVQEMQEIQVQSLGQEDSLEKEMVTHSSILAWEIPWIDEPGGYEHRVSKNWTQLSTHMQNIYQDIPYHTPRNKSQQI